MIGKLISSCTLASLLFAVHQPAAAQQRAAQIARAEQINPAAIQLVFTDSARMTIDFYAENIFRLFLDPTRGVIRDPQAKPPAHILVKDPRRPISGLKVTSTVDSINMASASISIAFSKETGLFRIRNDRNQCDVAEQIAPFQFDPKRTVVKLKEHKEEYFYGGGVQNGRFSHKGKAIAIENQNSWTDGGVASPNPFYWSTSGYGVMFYTFKKGVYDFGAKEKGIVELSHATDYLDVFFMIDEQPTGLLNDYYQLTGHPVLLPKFGFYEGHLNAYNRDYWKEDSTGILFEDGKRYKESQKDDRGIRESLNGELNNYQFSARAVIDRYHAHDMPLGWILPNDGYGAGYGQTNTLQGNIANLRSFGDYARSKGVEIGLWTQSDLHPIDTISALLQRDIVREVRDAGVRVLKTDVAWVGAGYSFGLHGVADVGHIMPYYGSDARPFIISLDGWAGTQRYATIWSGDQTGGVWEYIRFHIPTYLGSGLSGNPNITSDMDGIFGGKNIKVNVRDFQWKTFTPMQLNMDGWGANPKYPQALGEPPASINRNYLKLKSELLPYAYSIAYEALHGKPMIRPMFLDYPNKYTYGTATRYQFLYGPFFLVAPVYQETNADSAGNDIRNGIYLPEGMWIDYFTGQLYPGNRIINSVAAPLWKLPLFVKAGAIVPRVNPNNNVTQIDEHLRIYEVFPFGNSYFTQYDDDGKTEAYRYGQGAFTNIESEVRGNTATITIHATTGSFNGMVKTKITRLIVNVTEKPSRVFLTSGKENIRLREVSSPAEFAAGENVYYYDPRPDFNQFATKNSAFEKVQIIRNPQILIKTAPSDISQHELVVSIQGFRFAPEDILLRSSGSLSSPLAAEIADMHATPYTLTPTWKAVPKADYYEIRFHGQLYSTIRDTFLLFQDLAPETEYRFDLRAVNKTGHSDWASFSGLTKANPLEFAIRGIAATATAGDQPGNSISKLFDFDENSMWHTAWSKAAVPFDMIIDLGSVNQLDKLEYLPRDRGNGIILEGTIAWGNSKSNFSTPQPFTWTNDGSSKTFAFETQPTAQYVKIHVSKSVGAFGSGREMYIFRVPGSVSYLPGDINADRLIDANDLTSYANYMGLRRGDSDFEGYIERGDVDKNGRIDAFDISNVATRMRGGAKPDADTASGKLGLTPSRTSLNAGDIVDIVVKGVNLKAVNALGFAIPYNEQDYEFVAIKPLNTRQMENVSRDRLHTNGQKVLYPTYVNVGDKPALEGSADLFIIQMRAKRKLTYHLHAENGILVDKGLNVAKW